MFLRNTLSLPVKKIFQCYLSVSDIKITWVRFVFTEVKVILQEI